jgi:ribonuclease Z
MADHNKPLTIFYPADNDLFNDLFDFCGKRYDHWLRYNLNLVPITAGFELQLGKNIYVRAFDMLHQKRGTTLGFVIYENRKRLKPQYRGLDIPSVLRGGVASADLSEDYRANLFAYCLDAYGIPDAAVQLKDCDLAVMDTTFLDAKDRTDLTHFTLDEATKLCQDVGVKHMVAAHLGTRYDYSDYLFKTDTYTTVIDPNKVYHL